MIRRLDLVLTAAVLPAVWACGAEPGRGSEATGTAEGRPAASQVVTARAPEGCDLIPVAEVERLIGPIEGRPEREGKGCWYNIPIDSSAKAERLAPFESQRLGLFVGADVSGPALVAPEGSDTAKATGRLAGWDAVRASSRGTGFTGRVGHVTVTITLSRLRLPVDTLASLAARVRDRIPDRPFSHPAADPSLPTPAGRDPCSVLTRAEAEAVLGKLAVPPFRTREGTPLAEPAGKSCAYFTPGHRVLVLTPEWTYGKMALDAERMGAGLVSQVAEIRTIEADTLEGPWDDAVVGLSGDLVLLKGPRALGIGYLMSATDAAGAVRLAGPALKRLAAAPEPTRPRASADGCLPETLVSELVETPVRLFVNGMKLGGFCSYELVADPTVHVELTVDGAEAADSVFAAIQAGAKLMMGSSAQAERIDVGQGGWAYGSRSKSEAAARAGDKLYHARMVYPLGTTTPSRKEAMVRLVARMVE